MNLPNPLQQLHDLDRTSPQFHKQLIDILRGKEYKDVFPNLQHEDSGWLVEYLDSVIRGISDSASATFHELLHELRKICGIKEVLPKSCVLSDYALDISLPLEFGYVHEGTLDGSKVRVRRVGIYPQRDPQKASKTFHQVAVAWKHLTHTNIVPLLGVITNPPQLISDWVSGGDLTEYIAGNPDSDRLGLLSDIAEGLNYLHSCNVIHGDLKGSSVLVDTSGRARITDFGLAMITQDLDSIRNDSDEHGHSARWIAPEILDDRGTYSKEADVFSFAMVTIEAFTGAIPFSDKPSRVAMLAIIGGERPPRPTHPALTDRLWVLTQQCWDKEAHLRPNFLRISCSFGIPAWRRLIDRPLAKDQRISLITYMFSNRDETEAVKRLSGDDAQSFVDVIDESLDSLEPWLRGKCLATLCRICGHQALLPRSVQIPLCYDRMDAPLYHGGFAEVWKGEHQRREVAVKVLKIYKTSNLVKITKRFCKEVMTWRALRHQNVLSLVGVTMSNNQFTMVSEWMVNGNINEFVKAHRDENRFELLRDVARGLIYMHSQVMIHGDLKGANILIDNDGHARLADFGLLTIVSDSTHPTTSSSSKSSGTTKWMSPELLDPDRFGLKNSRPTKESDRYALGMVVLEVLTGQAPFPRYTGLTVMRKVVDGERPERPQGPEAVWFMDDLWETLEQCWSPQPKHRPTPEVVFERLEEGSMAWQPLSPGADGESEADSDDDSDFTVSYYPSGQTIPWGGGQSPVLSQSHPRSVVTGRSSSEPSSVSQQRSGEPPALPESVHDTVPTSYASGKLSFSPNDDSDSGSNVGETQRTTGDNTSSGLEMWRTIPQLEGRPMNLPPLIPVSKTRRQKLSGPRPLLSPPVHPPEYPPASRTPAKPPTKPPSSPGVDPDNRTSVSNENVQQPGGRLGVSFPEHDLNEPVIETSSGGTSSIVTDTAQPFRAPGERGPETLIRMEPEFLPKRSTKLWGSEMEEVTTGQAEDALPTLPRLAVSPSEPKPVLKWVRGDLISEGTYGKVYVALNATTGEMITVKQVEILRVGDGRSDNRRVTVMEALRHESEVLKELNHPNVVQYLGFEETPRHLNIFLEYVPGGSIYSILRKRGRFDEKVTKFLTSQILDGLYYLHSKGIIHRDLKTDNILVEEFGLCKISGFGISKKTDDINMMGAHTSMQGSVFWMAPEVINNKEGYNSKVDIWSVGCVVFEMWTGERPWKGQDTIAVLLRLHQSKVGPPLPEGFVLSPQGDDFRNSCFAPSPDERPSAGELRQHSYLVLPPGWMFTGFS